MRKKTGDILMGLDGVNVRDLSLQQKGDMTLGLYIYRLCVCVYVCGGGRVCNSVRVCVCV
jgi:hypothetical protein